MLKRTKLPLSVNSNSNASLNNLIAEYRHNYNIAFWLIEKGLVVTLDASMSFPLHYISIKWPFAHARCSLPARHQIFEWSVNLFFNSPQNGMPSGIHCPLSHTRRAGPNSSKPRSHVYDATVPLSSASSEKITLLCAGEPGKLHDCAEIGEKKKWKKRISEMMNVTRMLTHYVLHLYSRVLLIRILASFELLEILFTRNTFQCGSNGDCHSEELKEKGSVKSIHDDITWSTEEDFQIADAESHQQDLMA